LAFGLPGLPFSDPLADGTTVQMASEVALKNGVSVQKSFEILEKARGAGLTVPVVAMGYCNPLLAFGYDKVCAEAARVGCDGFIVVDLPADEAMGFVTAASAHHLSFVPLITPTTTNDRIAALAKMASSWLYVVSVAGVTGTRASVNNDLPGLVSRIKTHGGGKPFAVGFGVSTPEQVNEIGSIAPGVVVGSAIIKALDTAEPTPAGRRAAAKDLISTLLSCRGPAAALEVGPPGAPFQGQGPTSLSDDARFGVYGGRFIPETLVEAHEQLEVAYKEAKADPAFTAELARLRKEFVGGPTVMYHAKNLTKKCGGAQIWFKREEMAHTGAHKINNALGQCILAQRLGKPRIIAETGAGQHGVATATACALLGLDCVVYMGAEDVKRQSLNVFRMKMMGAKVIGVESGSKTLKDAINEAMRDWVTNVHDTHYCVGSAIGPHPFPTIVRDFQAVIGIESRAQILTQAGRLPDTVVACVGGGSNAIGMFHAFRNDKEVELIGVEAGGVEGISGKHSAPLSAGTPGVLHGTLTYLMQDDDGQIAETHSISAGLDYPGVGPEHAFLKDSGRAQYVVATDSEALDALQCVSRTEGIIPALEPSHALAWVMKRAAEMTEDKIILVNLCGRGDKDMISVAKALGVTLSNDEDPDKA